jgi:hypothetical protein
MDRLRTLSDWCIEFGRHFKHLFVQFDRFERGPEFAVFVLVERIHVRANGALRGVLIST